MCIESRKKRTESKLPIDTNTSISHYSSCVESSNNIRTILFETVYGHSVYFMKSTFLQRIKISENIGNKLF